jgi:hypothetical protein
LDFFNFCWVFQKFPFLCVTLYLANDAILTLEICKDTHESTYVSVPSHSSVCRYNWNHSRDLANLLSVRYHENWFGGPPFAALSQTDSKYPIHTFLQDLFRNAQKKSVLLKHGIRIVLENWLSFQLPGAEWISYVLVTY